MTILEKHFPDINYKVETDDAIKIYGKPEIMTELSGYMMQAGITVSELSAKEMSLEEYFIGITGGERK